MIHGLHCLSITMVQVIRSTSKGLFLFFWGGGGGGGLLFPFLSSGGGGGGGWGEVGLHIH